MHFGTSYYTDRNGSCRVTPINPRAACLVIVTQQIRMKNNAMRWLLWNMKLWYAQTVLDIWDFNFYKRSTILSGFYVHWLFQYFFQSVGEIQCHPPIKITPLLHPVFYPIFARNYYGRIAQGDLSLWRNTWRPISRSLKNTTYGRIKIKSKFRL